jgi:hypothetical protein
MRLRVLVATGAAVQAGVMAALAAQVVLRPPPQAMHSEVPEAMVVPV